MDVELFSHSVRTAIVGMAIVFASLSTLSALMYLLRVIVEPRDAKGEATDSADSADRSTDAVHSEENSSGGSALPVEVILAGAAYHLQYEERSRESSAHAWSAERRGAAG